MNESQKYTVVVSGVLAQDQSLETAREAFAKLFKVSIDKADAYFQGKPRVLRKNLESKQAKAYEQALKKIGLPTRLLPQEEEPQASAPEPDATAEKTVPPLAMAKLEIDQPPTKPAQTITCPKCGTEQPKSDSCCECGIFIEKFQQSLHQRERAIPARQSEQEQEQEQAPAEPVTDVRGDSASIPALGAALGAAIAGALLWKIIAVSFGMELGIVAWGIGAAVGFAAALLGGRGQTCGAVCGALALVAIIGGKYWTIETFKDDISSAMNSEEIWDAETEAYFEEIKVDAALYQDLDSDEASLRAFLVERSYSEAESASGVSQEEINLFHEYDEPTLIWINETSPSYQQWQQHAVQSIEEYSTLDMVTEDFGILDILFIVLGIGTAFRLGSGSTA